MLRVKHIPALLLTLSLHAGVWLLIQSDAFDFINRAESPQVAEKIVYLKLTPPTRQPLSEAPASPSSKPPSLRVVEPSLQTPLAPTRPSPDRPRASMDAPAPPSAEEWAFAARYTNKNSKGYRYSWGQQVRSMMGTAVEGPDQGFVRFRIEIAPDGTLAKLETIWTTSSVAEQLARKAVESMPPLPPTPTGKPLIFEKTISFTPFASDGPPSYKDDCLPDPPAFRNPFAWDGKSPQVSAEPPKTEKLDPQAMEECLRQLPQDSIEAEMARDKRAMERWGWK